MFSFLVEFLVEYARIMVFLVRHHFFAHLMLVLKQKAICNFLSDTMAAFLQSHLISLRDRGVCVCFAISVSAFDQLVGYCVDSINVCASR